MAEGWDSDAFFTDAFDTDAFDLEEGEGGGGGTDPTDYGSGNFDTYLDWRMYQLKRRKLRRDIFGD